MTKERNYFIDFMKFIFSFIIVAYHSWPFIGFNKPSLFKFGCVAVEFYFIVTGYLMMKSIETKGNKKTNLGISTFEFIKNKLKPVFPYILISFIIGSIALFKGRLISDRLLFSNSFVLEILQLGIVGISYNVNNATWYISSMLITLFILYPIAIKTKKNYPTLIAPLILLLFLILRFSLDINILDPISKTNFGLNGLYRAFIYIPLGNILYEITKKIKKLDFKKFGKIVLTTIEILSYIVVILAMHYRSFGDVLISILIAIAVMISFSSKSYTYKYLNFKIFEKLGKFGFIMYLNNIYVRNYMMNNGYVYSYKKTFIIYFIAVFVISLICYLIVPLLIKLLNIISKKIKGLILNTSN